MCPNSKKLSEEETSNMIRKTAVPPKDRQQKILEGLRSNGCGYSKDPYAQAFQFSVASQMVKIEAR